VGWRLRLHNEAGDAPNLSGDNNTDMIRNCPVARSETGHSGRWPHQENSPVTEVAGRHEETQEEK
jgi:hypothetical protein